MNEEIYHLPTDSYAQDAGGYLQLDYPRQIAEWCHKHLTLSKDCFGGRAGAPVCLLPHQEKILNTALGWRSADGTFRFRRVFIFQPRRSGKTMLCAILSTLNLLQGQGKEIVNLASTVDQAKALFLQVADFIRFNGQQFATHKYHFAGHDFWIRQHLKTIEVMDTHSSLKILAASNRGIAGRGLSLCILDEISQFPKAYVQDTWDYLQDSGASVPNSQLWTISTPSTDFSHLWRTTIYKKCKDILEGADNDVTTLPINFETTPEEFGDGPQDEDWAGFAKIPGCDLTVPKKYYINEWNACKSDPVEVVRFKVMNSCMHENSPEVWVDENAWQRCYEPFREDQLWHKYPAICAVDFGSCFDLCAIQIMVQKDDVIYLCPRSFIPKDIAFKRQTADHFAYVQHSQTPANNIFLPPGEVIAGETLVERVKYDKGLFGFSTVYYDPKRMELSRQALEKNRLECISVSTAPSTMSQLAKHFKSLVMQGKIRHNNNPLQNYTLRNCRPKINHKDELTIEKAGDYQKIDLIIAAIIGCGHFLKNTEISKPIKQSYVQVWGR